MAMTNAVAASKERERVRSVQEKLNVPWRLPWLHQKDVIVMNWLCVEVRYLFNKYHGSRDGGRRPDYPPSAHRMFEALAAAANNGQGMSDAAKEALQWLEKQSPPEIIVPES